MTALPEWIEVAWTNGHERVVHHEKLKEALAIAWEALEWYPKYFGDNTTLQSRMAKEALRRITELGKD